MSYPCLAIHGGQPAIPEGPPDWPPADEQVRAALLSAYEDGSWGRYHGPHCARLAELLANMHAVEHVLLCSSGTVAVEIALRGLGIESGDEVALAAYDFPGNFRAIEAVGARPVLVDVDPRTWSLDAAALAEAMSAKVRCIIASHLHGGMADMPAICRVASEHGATVIEDACQAQGARVYGRIAGTWGDVGVLSFGGSKLLTAGRGGALVMRDAMVHQRAKIFCDWGNDAFPMSELQAAVLPPQLEKLAARNETRRDNVKRLLAALREVKALTPVLNPADAGHASYYKLAWLYDSSHCGGANHESFVAAARAEGVALDTGFHGFARRPERRCRKVGDLPHAQRAAESTVLLHHPVLLESAETIDRVAAALQKVATGLVR